MFFTSRYLEWVEYLIRYLIFSCLAQPHIHVYKNRPMVVVTRSALFSTRFSSNWIVSLSLIYNMVVVVLVHCYSTSFIVDTLFFPHMVHAPVIEWKASPATVSQFEGGIFFAVVASCLPTLVWLQVVWDAGNFLSKYSRVPHCVWLWLR